jgi:hypothetical protein
MIWLHTPGERAYHRGMTTELQHLDAYIAEVANRNSPASFKQRVTLHALETLQSLIELSTAPSLEGDIALTETQRAR